MSRQDGPNRSVSVSRSALGSRGRGGLAVWLGLLLLLLAGGALAGGIDVTVADSSLLTVKPREVVTRVFRVTNRTGAPGTFQSQLMLPQGWRAITPDFPFQLAPGASAMRLASFFAPEHTAAGDYRVGFRVVNASLQGPIGGASLSVRVLPVFKLQVDILDLPAVAIVGEPYTAVFQIGNYSNSPLTVGYGAESSRGSKLKPAAGTLTLAPGEARPVEIAVRPVSLKEATHDQIRLTASAPEHGLSDKAERSVETLPRTGAQQEEYYTLNTQFTQRLGASWGGQNAGWGGGQGNGNGGGWGRTGVQGAFQLEWSGSGPVDGSGERFLNFLIRGPDLNQYSIFGQESMVYLDYRGKSFDWGIGNLPFLLSPLTESGVSGVGGRLGWHNDSWRVNAWHVQDWDSNEDWGTGVNGEETGLSIGHAVRPNWWVGVNYLNGNDDEDGAYQVLSLRQQIQLKPDLGLDLELAGSSGELGNGSAVWLDLNKTGTPWRYRLNLLYADPQFAGEYQDENFAHLDLGYSPADSPWSTWGFYRYDQTNQAQQIDRYRYQDRSLYRYRPMTVVVPAQTEQTAGVGAAWRAPDSSRYSAELRYGECRNGQAAGTPFYDVTHVLRLGYGKTFKEQNLSLDSNVEFGRRFDHVTGQQLWAWGYRGSLFWRPSNRWSLGTYLNDTIDPCSGDAYGNNDLPTLGLSAGYMPNDKSSYSVNVQAQQSNGQSQVVANAQYNYRRANGHVIGVQAQYANTLGDDIDNSADANLMVSYTVPIKVATMRRMDIGTLRGQVVDQDTGKGIPNIVLKMDRLVAITDEYGNFTFPSVRRGYYTLNVAGGRLPVGMIPTTPMPMDVDLGTSNEERVKIAYIRGATVTGVVQVYAPDPKLLPSQTFVRTGSGGPLKTPAPTKQDLVPTEGLGGILVEVRQGDRVYRRMTNGNGEFRFAGLLPGTWTVTIDPEALPENASIEESRYTLEVKPSGEAKVEFRVEQRIRSMRMLAPLKVGG